MIFFLLCFVQNKLLQFIISGLPLLWISLHIGDVQTAGKEVVCEHHTSSILISNKYFHASLIHPFSLPPFHPFFVYFEATFIILKHISKLVYWREGERRPI